MANIKELKKRIKSTKGTYKITTAMKLVSAAKLARAQEAITGSRPYARELDKTIKTISALIQNYSHPFLVEGELKKSLLLIISSDKGLCGSYNSMLTKRVRKFLAEKTQVGEEFKVSNIGKKVRGYLQNEVNLGKLFAFNKSEPTYFEIAHVAKELSDLFESGEYGKIYIAYNHFRSAIVFEPNVDQVLPMVLSSEEKEALKKEFPFDFKYDSSPKEILDSLIPEAYLTTIYTYLLDALASEHGSRMGAMENASKNCAEVFRDLTLTMNKMRQAAITTELIEVVSGAEALNG